MHTGQLILVRRVPRTLEALGLKSETTKRKGPRPGLDVATVKQFGHWPRRTFSWTRSPRRRRWYPPRPVSSFTQLLGVLEVTAATAALVLRWRQVCP